MLLVLSLGERKFSALYLAAPHLAAPRDAPAQYSRHNSLADFLRPLAASSSFETAIRWTLVTSLKSRLGKGVTAGDRVDAGFLLESGAVCVQVASSDVNPKD